MIKSKKSSARPEITIVDVRPLNQSPLNNDPFANARSLRSASESTNNGNGYAFATLPSTVVLNKKQRPKSEIYNGFNSLRSMKGVKVNEEELRKEAKKVSRSKSLYAPKKPPRDLPLRPAPVPPSRGAHESQEPSASISPSRPAPPVPMTSFNKKGPASKNVEPDQSEERRDRMKRLRSKSTSTVSEKSRGPSTLPRGKSFNNHGQKHLIKSAHEDNVFILTRSNSVEQSRERDVKLTTFGAKASKPANGHAVKERTGTALSEAPEETSNSKHPGTSDPPGDARAKSDGCVTLGDAIQSSAVFARLQQKNEKLTGVESDTVKQDDSTVVTLNEAINSSPVLAKIKEKNKMTDDIPTGMKEAAATRTNENTEQPANLEKGGVNSASSDHSLQHYAGVQGEVSAVKALSRTEGTEHPLNGVKPVASYVVKTDNQHKKIKDTKDCVLSVGVPSAKPGSRRMSAPPAVKPKPRRPSVDKQNSLDVGKAPDTQSRMFSADIPSEEIGSNAKMTALEDVKKEDRLTSDLSNRDGSEDLRSDSGNTPCESIAFRRTMSESKPIKVLDDHLSGRSVLTRTQSESKPAGRNNKQEDNDNVFEETPLIPGAKSESRAGNDGRTVENNLPDTAAIPRTKSESEPESSGSVDSLTSLSSQITVIFKGDVNASDVGAAAGQPAPFQSHSSLGMQKVTPEPYSSHPGRRPKLGKPEPVTSTTKTRNRKSRSIKGRRLNSSPPSTPPPPPIPSSPEKVSRVAIKDQPPVPPRAPSMYVQNDLRSLDSIATNSDSLEKEAKSPPPPRPAKPPSAVHLFKGDNRKSSLQNDSINRVANEANSIDLEKNPAIAGAAGADKDGTTTGSFSQKLEFFQSNTEKPIEQRALKTEETTCGAHVETVGLDSDSSSIKTVDEVRREGKEALAFVSRIKKENSETKVETRKKSPAPQKPKRPLSFSMDNFILSESVLSDKSDSPEANAMKSSKAPQKPGRSLASFKALSLDERTTLEAKRADEVAVGQVDLRSADTALYENLTPNKTRKDAPKKPVRTSSLRVKDGGTPRKTLESAAIFEKETDRKVIEFNEEGNDREKNITKMESASKSLLKDQPCPSDETISVDSRQVSILEEVTRSAAEKEELEGPSQKFKSMIVKGEVKSPCREHRSTMEKEEANGSSQVSKGMAEREDVKCSSQDSNAMVKKEEVNGSNKESDGMLEKEGGKCSSQESKDIAEKEKVKGPSRESKSMVEEEEVKGPSRESKSMVEEEEEEVKGPSRESKGIDVLKEDHTLAKDHSILDSPNSMTSEASNTLSSQIEELDRILLETSTVLSESFQSIDDPADDIQQSCSVKTRQLAANHTTKDLLSNNVDLQKFDGNICASDSSEANHVILGNGLNSIDRIIEKSKGERKERHNQGTLSNGETKAKSVFKINSEDSPNKKFDEPLVNAENDGMVNGDCSNRTSVKITEHPQGRMNNTADNEGQGTMTDSHVDIALAPVQESIEIQCNTEAVSKAAVSLPGEASQITRRRKGIPAKPPRPRSFPKVISASCIMTSGTSEPRKVPPRPPSLENSPAKLSRARRKSAPARPDAPPVSYRSRPPIPPILRENSADDEDDKVAKPHAIAVYDYEASDTKDLAFKTGDTIMLEFHVNSDWLFGSVGCRRGMVPTNHVKVVAPLPSNKLVSHVDQELLTLDRPLALAVHPFVADDERELSFQAGDVIELLSKKNDDWLQGCCNGRSGIFPASFVVVVRSLPSKNSELSSISIEKKLNFKENSPEKPVVCDLSHSKSRESGKDLNGCKSTDDLSGRLCVATADFVGDSEDTLSFEAGQNIRIISKEDYGWLRGTLADRTGIFPSSFVQIIEDNFDAGVQEYPTDKEGRSNDVVVHPFASEIDTEIEGNKLQNPNEDVNANATA